MTFGDALEYMKAGRKMRRITRPYIIVYVDYSRTMKQYLVFTSKHIEQMPYVATNADIFADDWEITNDG